MDTSLGILSPEGQAHERLTEHAWEAILDHFPDLVRSDLGIHHSADAILRDHAGRAKMLVEIKSRRDFDEQMFWRRHKGLWLISAHKLTNNIPIAKEIGASFVGAMHIVQDRVVLLQTLFSIKDGQLPGISVRTTRTRANIHTTEMKERPCAFVPMHNALRIKY